MSIVTRVTGPLFLAAASLVIGAGCAHAPKTQHQAQAIESEAEATLNTMVARDPSLQNVLADAAGYVVFPEVGKGGAIVGGARGIGVVYENGQPIGYAELTQASIGLQLGGQTFSELIVFDNEQALARLKSGDLDVTANASAVALSSGAGAQADFQGGSEVFYLSRGGLMAGLDVAGQKINFKPEPPPHQ